MHDVGKPKPPVASSRTDAVTFRHHDVVGAKLARSGCRR